MIRHGANPHLRLGFVTEKYGKTIEHGMFLTPMDVFEMVYDGWVQVEYKLEVPEGIGSLIRELSRCIVQSEARQLKYLWKWGKQRHTGDDISRYRGRSSLRQNPYFACT